ncbi:MAG: excinuclease ABC subunit UvrC [Chitinivibrionales bacterium]|nr:excinuclease ABC subunit UvrC [Chitinivibrionales bacterium]
MDSKQLKEHISQFPHTCGVYIMKDSSGHILYIGKAVDLRQRFRSYCQEDGDGRLQIPLLLSKAATFEWIATANETEALILEANLIRMHKPAYNIDLKDDKHYPYIKIVPSEPFAPLRVVRRVSSDKARYFGPFTDARHMRSLIEFLRKTFKIRTCTRSVSTQHRVRPCINYAIGRCSGACAGLVSRQEYDRSLCLAMQFLTGKRREVINQLQEAMAQKASSMHYEQAASIRDQLRIIQSPSPLQSVDLKSPDSNVDVFAVVEQANRVCLCVLSIRQGVLLGKRHFIIPKQSWLLPFSDHDSTVMEFFHDSLHSLPDEIVVPADMGFNADLISQTLSTHYEKKISCTSARRGDKASLLALAEKNGELYLALSFPQQELETLEQLRLLCNLPTLPMEIEAFDISNLGPYFAVCGMVHFYAGKPQKSEYRRFKIKGVDGQNDFAMLLEAVKRRLTGLTTAGKPFPDLILIDGGKGQLSAAAEACSHFVAPPALISLAKQEELIFTLTAHEPIRLAANHGVRKLLQAVRDEVHRFSLAYHRTLRGKQYTSSLLETVAGVGKAKAALLLRTFGSVKKMKTVSVEELAAVPGISPVIAEALFHSLHSPSEK